MPLPRLLLPPPALREEHEPDAPNPPLSQLPHKAVTWGEEAGAAAPSPSAFGLAYSTTAANYLAAAAAASKAVAKENSEHFEEEVQAAVPIGEAFAKATEEGLPTPDRVFFLDIKPEDTLGREGYVDVSNYAVAVGKAGAAGVTMQPQE
ncbi:uncharacterized protein LOC34623834 [Cyclospora cayetanensis]|uniref:Uncharacterized protein LOC34623834 n=1 Tax=Cyclospora cayetanensis TaxID=88456 RepID=A0A6P6RX96_9EIME|nr:uncharacterized protein LOC34623834 [Cyclospora cayetanensis]